jgi:hypothetical protein
MGVFDVIAANARLFYRRFMSSRTVRMTSSLTALVNERTTSAFWDAIITV